MQKVEDIVATCVQEGALHLISLCELGDHRQGLKRANINYQDLSIFKVGKGPLASVVYNYLTAWNFDTDASQLSVRLARTPEIHSPDLRDSRPQARGKHVQSQQRCLLDTRQLAHSHARRRDCVSFQQKANSQRGYDEVRRDAARPG